MTRTTYGVHTTPTNPMSQVWAHLKHCGSVKFVTEFKDNDVLLRMKAECHPNTVFIGRYIKLDIENTGDGTPGELHEKYRALSPEDKDGAYALGVWYATLLGKLVIANGLQFMFWESGPNEANDVSPRAVYYELGFLDTFIAMGLKAAIGDHFSYGMPRVAEWGGIDDMAIFVSVFQAIDAVNRGPDGKHLSSPIAIYDVHEGAGEAAKDASGKALPYPGMMESVPSMAGRYTLWYDRYIKPNGWWVPIVASEFAYGADRWTTNPPTEIMVKQIQDVTVWYAQRDEFLAYNWYSYCETDRNTSGDFSGVSGDIERGLAAMNFSHEAIVPPDGAIIEVPPEEPPDQTAPGDYRVTAYALNVRDGPSVNNAKVGLLRNGNVVKVLETVGDWSRIEPVVQNWVCNDYLEEII